MHARDAALDAVSFAEERNELAQDAAVPLRKQLPQHLLAPRVADVRAAHTVRAGFQTAGGVVQWRRFLMKPTDKSKRSAMASIDPSPSHVRIQDALVEIDRVGSHAPT